MGAGRKTWISLALAAAFALAGLQASAGAATAAGAITPAGAATPAGATAPAGATEIPSPADIGTWGPGSWCWFGDPRAVTVSGQTFVGWIDWRGGIHVGDYNPGFGVVADQTIAYLYHDDHSSPSIL